MADASTPHLRWRLEVPFESEDALTDWLMDAGATAFYREADPPQDLLAYFPPGVPPPQVDGLGSFGGVKLLGQETFDDEDWLSKSREGFGCIEVGAGFFVRPRWEDTPAPEGRRPIVVNPGLAFGTGGHETTRLCLELLERLQGEQRLGGRTLDVGSGTGILALGAWMLGARDILAFDIDPDCGPAMEDLMTDNAGELKGERPFRALVGTLAHPEVQAFGPVQGMLANILLETIQELLPQMVALLSPGAWLVASGILAEREDEAFVSLTTHGLIIQEVRREGAWIAILAEKATA